MNKAAKSIAISAFSVFTMLGLSACYKPPIGPTVIQYRPLSFEQRDLAAQIRAQGVQVIRVGDHLTLVIPIDTFFRPQSTELRRDKLYAVRQVARLVASYAAGNPNFTVRVYGYSDKVFRPGERHYLSQEYARVIASYLWHRGIPENRMLVRGMGAKNPIASNRYPAGTAYNRRVVIEVY